MPTRTASPTSTNGRDLRAAASAATLSRTLPVVRVRFGRGPMSGVPTAGLGRRRPKLTPARVVSLGFATAIAVGTMLLLLPAASQPGVDTTALQSLFTATSADVPDRVDRRRHPDALVGVRAGRHPGPDPGRRARDHDDGLTGGAAAGEPDRAAGSAERGRRGGGVRPGRRPCRHRRRRADERADRNRRRGAAHRTLRARLRRATAAGAVAGRIPLDLGVQQRRVRALQREHDRLRRRPVDLCAPDGGGGARRDRVSGVVRDRTTPAPPIARMESAHQADRGYDGAAAGRRPVRGAAAGSGPTPCSTSGSGRSCSSRRFRG